MDGGTLPLGRMETPFRRMGYPLSGRMGYLPLGRMGYPPVGKDGATPINHFGVPPLQCEQTDTCENSTFPHPSDSGGNGQS